MRRKDGMTATKIFKKEGHPMFFPMAMTDFSGQGAILYVFLLDVSITV